MNTHPPKKKNPALKSVCAETKINLKAELLTGKKKKA